MEGVGVFHREFADADKACAGACFVTVFRLDLVKHRRKLLVGSEFRSCNLHNGLFMRHAENHGLAVAVRKAEKFLADLFITAAFLPEFGWKDDGHQDFLTADAIHFFADDGLDFVCDFISERQQGEETRGDWAAVTATNQIDMGDGLCVSGGFFQTLSDKLGEFHGYVVDMVDVDEWFFFTTINNGKRKLII